MSITITRPVAFADREICWRQYSPHDNDSKRQEWAKQFNSTFTLLEPSFGVNWYEAVDYCRWLGKICGLNDADQCYSDADEVEKDSEGYPRNWPLRLDRTGFRLPTAAEWEVACRGEMKTSRSFGGDLLLMERYAWNDKNSQGWSKPVGQLLPDSRGLFDMHGNLWEWTHDWLGKIDESKIIDPIGADAGDSRVTRGGCWFLDARFLRTAIRNAEDPSVFTNRLGFRVALSLPIDTPDKLAPGKVGVGEASEVGNDATDVGNRLSP